MEYETDQSAGKAESGRARRRAARRELLAHARWQITLSHELIADYRAEAGPVMRACFALAPFGFGRRASHAERIRRHMRNLRHHLA
jgi:hypothetical protein